MMFCGLSESLPLPPGKSYPSFARDGRRLDRCALAADEEKEGRWWSGVPPGAPFS